MPGSAAREAIADPANQAWVSAASIWEIAIKQQTGRFTIDGDAVMLARECGFALLDIRASHAARAGTLPDHHRDPFGRMLVAQAQVGGLDIVTHDRRLAAHDVQVIHA